MSNRRNYKKYWIGTNIQSIPSSLNFDISNFSFSYNAKILDIGCGHADLLMALKHLGYNDLYGVDINTSSNVIDTAKIHLYQSDASKLPFPNCIFEICIMKALLTVVVSDYSILRIFNESYRVLKHGGKLIIKDFFQNWHLPLYRERYLSNREMIKKKKCIFPVFNEEGRLRYYARHFNTQELSLMLIRVGFVLENIFFESVKTQSGNTVIGFTIIAKK